MLGCCRPKQGRYVGKKKEEKKKVFQDLLCREKETMNAWTRAVGQRGVRDIRSENAIQDEFRRWERESFFTVTKRAEQEMRVGNAGLR